MKITIHQPEHLPWLGLLAKIQQAEVWVVLDNVPFRKNYFQNRNKVLLGGRPHWLTVPVASGTRNIADVPISDTSGAWATKYMRTLQHAYPGAWRDGLLEEVAAAVESAAKHGSLLDLNLALAEALMARFGVTTPLVRASSLAVSGAKSDLILSICEAMGAAEYLAGPSGRDYLDLESFARAGIAVSFMEFQHPEYPQGKSDGFVPYLSSVDAIANVDPTELSGLLVTPSPAHG